ncbi:MAG: branched-chain amino acid ABC transporter permease [Firmicutes bacterium]|nr:branched-chain amino acid ABC transporter permease [Bacillota bacterium]
MRNVNPDNSRKQRILKTLIFAAIIIGILALADTKLRGFYLGVFLLFGINAIACLGVSITNSYANIFSLGFGGIMLMAAYTCVLFTLPVSYKESTLTLPLWLENLQAPFILALIVSGIVAVLSSIVLVLPAFRLRGHYFVLASMGINIVMTNLAINMRAYTHGPLGLRNIPFHTNVWWVYGLLALTVFFVTRFKRSKFGRALIAIGKDQTLAAALGIDVVKYKIYAFVIGSFIVGISGALWVHYTGSMHPNVFDLNFVFHIIAMLAVGGSGSVTGALLGAAIITAFTHLARPIQEGFALFSFDVPPLIGLIQVLLAVVVVLIMIFRPDGLIGSREITFNSVKCNFVMPKAREEEKG